MRPPGRHRLRRRHWARSSSRRGRPLTRRGCVARAPAAPSCAAATPGRETSLVLPGQERVSAGTATASSARKMSPGPPARPVRCKRPFPWHAASHPSLPCTLEAALDSAGSSRTLTPAAATGCAEERPELSIRVLEQPLRVSKQAQPALRFTADREDCTYFVRLDGAPECEVHSPVTFPYPLADGEHWVAIGARVAASDGSAEEALTTLSWRLDTSPPAVSITRYPKVGCACHTRYTSTVEPPSKAYGSSRTRDSTAEFELWSSEEFVSFVYFVDRRLLGVRLVEGIYSSERVTDGEIGASTPCNLRES
eukprot:scaffold1_cov402-Prasinococcus_capsulatus_cf.AAC.45